MIDLFLDELDKDRDEDIFTKEELELGFVSIAILFFFAGFDTTSNTLSLVVHALIHHPEIQEKLRDEIEEVIGDSDIVTTEHLKDIKVLESIIHESMRKYMPMGKLDLLCFESYHYSFDFSFSAIQRVCTKDYKIPDTNFIIPKGLNLTLLPKKNECFANPEVFDIENFTESDSFNKFGYTGFGQGPRNCIGKESLQKINVKNIWNGSKCENRPDWDEKANIETYLT